MKNIILILFLIACFFNSLFAQDAFIKQYTIRDGFPATQIYDIYISQDGLLWCATSEGLIRFDGKKTIIYTKDDGLSDDKTRVIEEDFSGRLWFFNQNGTANYYYKNKIYNQTDDALLGDLKTFLPFSGFFQDPDSTLYFFNMNSEVYEVKNHTLTDVSNFKNKPIESGLNYLNKMPDGRFLLWYLQGIYIADGIDGNLTLLPHPIPLLKVFPVNRNECIGIEKGGYLNYYVDSILVRKHFLKCETDNIISILFDTEGYLWIASHNKGIFCYKGDKLVERFNINHSTKIIMDQENNIWIGTLYKGIYKINRNFLKYKYYKTDRFGNRGLLGLALSRFGGIWATNGSQIYLIKGDNVLELPFLEFGNQFNSMYHLKNDTLIVSGRTGNVYVFWDVRYEDKTNSLYFDKLVKSIIWSKKFLVDKKEENFYSFMDNIFIKSSLVARGTVFFNFDIGLINNVYIDRNENIIINSALMNSRFRGKNLYDYPNLDSLDGKNILCHLNLDSDNELYAVDRKDLFLLNKDKLYDLSKGFKNQIDYTIRDMDYFGTTLFFSTIKNVFFIHDPINIPGGQPIELHKLDVEFSNVNDILCYDSSLYVASDDGLTVFPLDSIKVKETIPPRPFFEKIVVDDETVAISDRIIVSGRLHKLLIEFYSLNFSSLSTIYSYKLEGYDNNWTEGYETRAVYSNLPPGNYTFKLLTKRAGEGKTNSDQIFIFVKPTFFQRTITWIGISLVFLLGIVFIIIEIKNRQIRQKEIEGQLISLENKALQSMMNPHFIFNALGSIQSFLLQNKSEEASYYLSQFARLIRQNFNSLKSNYISIEEEVDRLKNYLEIENFRLSFKFRFEIHVDPRLDTDEICIPSMIIQPFIENAVWHGISPLQGEGFIQVRFEKNDKKSIYAYIEDNGIGIEKASAFSKSEQHLKLGIELTRKRIKLIGELNKVNAQITTEDLNPGLENPGTRVKIIVPILME
jgi:two-component sensor histidine kinase